MDSTKTFCALATLLLLATAAGCGGSTPEARAADRQRRNALLQCTAAMEVYTPGNPPQRPYRVIAPVEGTFGWTVESRFEKMRKRACELGAQAIVDASEHYDDVSGTRTTTITRDQFGRPIATIEEPHTALRRTTAMAVVFTDGAPPAPVTQGAPPGPGAPQIIIVNVPPAR